MRLRPVSNPPNPFERVSCEWLGPPPETPVHVYEETARSILASNDSPDIPFRWSLNPYRGCQHACAYCYARRTHEYLGFGAGTDFETRITAKVNAPELLRTALAKKSWNREWIAFSGVTDCYQPIEAVYGLTRGCLEVCREFNNPLGIVTKSYLIVRDADLLAEIARRTSVVGYISLAFLDERVSRLIDAGAPSPARRLAAIRTLRDAGVPVAAMAAPIIPGLNDREIPQILEACAEAGASRVGYTPLRLPGNVREVFLDRLRAALPDRAARVEALLRDLRGGGLNESRFGARMRGQGNYWESIRRLFEVHVKRLGLNAPSRDDPPVDAVLPDPPVAKGSAGIQLPLFDPD